MRKPAHLGTGPYSEIERRLYLPQWFQHEFMHHLYRSWPEFELEKTSHSWFNRFTWPEDFVGQFEPDYYSESLNKRLLTATPSLGEGLSLPEFLTLTASNLELLEGRYTRLPIENDFHDVTVTVEDGIITWANLALSWQLIIDEGRLFSEAGSPYGIEPVLVELDEGGAVTALIFLGERYERAAS